MKKHYWNKKFSLEIRIYDQTGQAIDEQPILVVDKFQVPGRVNSKADARAIANLMLGYAMSKIEAYNKK